MTETASGRLEATARTRSYGWQALDSARDQRYTGALVIDVGEEIRLFFDVGTLYLAERAADPPLPDRLLAVGVVGAAELAAGTVEVGGVAHLGRLFDRAPSVDRDRVVTAIELMNDEVVASIAGLEVRAAEALPYRHHPSGIQRWSDEPIASAEPVERAVETLAPAEPVEGAGDPVAEPSGEPTANAAVAPPTPTAGPSAEPTLPPPPPAAAVLPAPTPAPGELPAPAPIAAPSPTTAPAAADPVPADDAEGDTAFAPSDGAAVEPVTPISESTEPTEPTEPALDRPVGAEDAAGVVISWDEPGDDDPVGVEVAGEPVTEPAASEAAVVEPLIRPLQVPGPRSNAPASEPPSEPEPEPVSEPVSEPEPDPVSEPVSEPATVERLIRPLQVPGPRPATTAAEPVSEPAAERPLRPDGMPNLPTGAERRARRDLEISSNWTATLDVEPGDPDPSPDGSDRDDSGSQDDHGVPDAPVAETSAGDQPEPAIEIVWPSGDVVPRTAADAPANGPRPVDRPLPGASARLAIGKIHTSSEAAFDEPAPATAASEAVVFEIDWSLGAAPPPATRPEDEAAATDVLDDVMHAVRRTVAACETRVARSQEPQRPEQLGSLARLGGVMPSQPGHSVFDEVLAPSFAVPAGQPAGEDRSGALKRLIGSLKRP